MQAQGTFNSKQRLVVAGLPIARKVFEILDSSLEWQGGVEDGTEVVPGTPLASVSGAAGPLLAGERVALNFLQHLSGIATYARRLEGGVGGNPRGISRHAQDHTRVCAACKNTRCAWAAEETIACVWMMAS